VSVVVARCPLCGSDNHQIFERVHDRGWDLTYQLCKSCGMVFQSPRMSDEELEQFYLADYRLLVQNDEGPSDKDLRIQSGRARNLLAFAQPHLDQVQTHLDIGSSAGALLLEFRRAYGCASYGVEPGEAYRNFSKELGLRVVADLADLDRGLSKSFDLITMAHVLEHVPDPVAYLRQLTELWLAPDGYLLLEVPNLFGHPAFEVAHLTAFSKATLCQVLHEAGYQIVVQKVHGAPRSHLIPLYLTVLARGNGRPIESKPLQSRSRWVYLERGLGKFWRRWASRIAPRWAWLPLPEMSDTLSKSVAAQERS
jgi:SAM-dependent methyltransferase